MTLGVIADTHVPDRARRLHPAVLACFRQAGVAAILHAGDISAPRLLAELGTLAPVYAVRGNRDWLWLRHLPSQLSLNFAGISIGLLHGHGGLRQYLRDHPYFALHGYQHERLLPTVLAAFPTAQVIVFGHGHVPLNERRCGQLLFNPGSPHFPARSHPIASVGLLHLQAGGEVWGEIIALPPVG